MTNDLVVDVTYASGCLSEDIIREIASMEVQIPELITLIKSPQTNTYNIKNEFSSFHWSRQYEYTWSIIHSNINKNHVCLDAGGGYSVLQYAIAKRCQSLTLIDINQESLDKAKKNAKTFNLNNIEYINSPIQEYNNPTQYDRIFCISVLEHIPEKEIRFACIRKMIDMLKPDGELFLSFDFVIRTGNNTYDFYISRQEAVEIIDMFKELSHQDTPYVTGLFDSGCVLGACCLHIRRQK